MRSACTGWPAAERLVGGQAIRAFVRARGLKLVATNLDWSRGSGPEVRGPGEAILMAIAGRGDAIDELSGPGRSVLAERVHT